MGWQAVEMTRVARMALTVGVLALAAGAPVAAAGTTREALLATAPVAGEFGVALEQCLGAGAQAERSATFVAQMVATVATQKMAVKIQLEERMRGEAEYHGVLAPGFGIWRSAEPGVKIYKYVKQVTNLTAPAAYRAVVHFRWVGDRGRTLKRAEARSARCFEPVSPATASSASSGS
jgi:hypothetical protein